MPDQKPEKKLPPLMFEPVNTREFSTDLPPLEFGGERGDRKFVKKGNRRVEIPGSGSILEDILFGREGPALKLAGKARERAWSQAYPPKDRLKKTAQTVGGAIGKVADLPRKVVEYLTSDEFDQTAGTSLNAPMAGLAQALPQVGAEIPKILTGVSKIMPGGNLNVNTGEMVKNIIPSAMNIIKSGEPVSDAMLSVVSRVAGEPVNRNVPGRTTTDREGGGFLSEIGKLGTETAKMVGGALAFTPTKLYEFMKDPEGEIERDPTGVAMALGVVTAGKGAAKALAKNIKSGSPITKGLIPAAMKGVAEHLRVGMTEDARDARPPETIPEGATIPPDTMSERVAAMPQIDPRIAEGILAKMERGERVFPAEQKILDAYLDSKGMRTVLPPGEVAPGGSERVNTRPLRGEVGKPYDPAAAARSGIDSLRDEIANAESGPLKLLADVWRLQDKDKATLLERAGRRDKMAEKGTAEALAAMPEPTIEQLGEPNVPGGSGGLGGSIRFVGKDGAPLKDQIGASRIVNALRTYTKKDAWGQNEWLNISDLRKALLNTDMTRKQVDDALLELDRSGVIELIHNDDLGWLAKGEAEGALDIAGFKRHKVKISDTFDPNAQGGQSGASGTSGASGPPAGMSIKYVDDKGRSVPGRVPSKEPRPTESGPVSELMGAVRRASGGTGEFFTPQRAKNIEAEAIAKGFIGQNEWPDLPQAERQSFTALTDRIVELQKTNPGLIKAVAMDRAVRPIDAPIGLYQHAVEHLAEKQGDVTTLHELARTAPAEITAAARTLGSLRETDVISPVVAIRDVMKYRAERAKNTGTVIPGDEAGRRITELEGPIARLTKELEPHESSAATRGIIEEAKSPSKRTTTGYGSKNRIFTTDRYEAAKARYIAVMSQTRMGMMDLRAEAIAPLVEMGAYHIEAGARSFGEWSGRMVSVAGEGIRDHLKTIYAQSREAHLQETLAGIKQSLDAGIKAGKSLNDMGGVVRRLGKLYADNGVLDEGKLVEAVQRTLGEVIPDVDAAKTTSALAATYRKRMVNDIDRAENRLLGLDFEEAPRLPTRLDKEGARIKAHLEALKLAERKLRERSGDLTPDEVKGIVERSRAASQAREALDAGQKGTGYGLAMVELHKYVDLLKKGKRPTSRELSDAWLEFKVTAATSPVAAMTDAAWKMVKSASENMIALVASVDDSFLGRQGLATLQTHPEIWLDMAGKSFKDFYTSLIKKNGYEAARDAVLAEAYERPNFRNGNYNIAKLLPAFEEQFPKNVWRGWPILGRFIGASEASFTNSAIRARINLFDKLYDIAGKNGVTLDKPFVKNLGKLINSLTARGDLGRTFEGGAVRMLLWAPKKLKGDIDVLTMHGLGKGLLRTGKTIDGQRTPDLQPEQYKFLRNQAANNLLQITGQTLAAMAIANALSPGSAEVDPRSSKFGKITVKSGSKVTTFDLTGGRGSIVTLISRIVGGIKRAGGEITPVGTGGAMVPDMFTLGLDFLLRKTTPLASVGTQIARKKYYGTEPLTTENVWETFLPISVRNFMKNFMGEEPNDETEAIVGSFLDLFGISTQTYDEKKSGRKSSKSKKSLSGLDAFYGGQ